MQCAIFRPAVRNTLSLYAVGVLFCLRREDVAMTNPKPDVDWWWPSTGIRDRELWGVMADGGCTYFGLPFLDREKALAKLNLRFLKKNRTPEGSFNSKRGTA
jgi:hypothetical protein